MSQLETTPLRVLLLEDSAIDAELLLHELRRAAFRPEWRRVDTEDEYLAELKLLPQLILADYSLPQFDALAALHLLQEQQMDIPFIVVTGAVGEEAVVTCMHEGASDYLLKDRLGRLGPAVRRGLAMSEARAKQRSAERALQESEARYRRIVETAGEGIWVRDAEGRTTFVNDRMADIVGYRPEEMLGRAVWEFVPGEYPEISRIVLERQRNGDSQKHDGVLSHKDGSLVWVSAAITPIVDGAGEYTGSLGMLSDITHRKQAEQAMEASEQRFRTLIDRAPFGICIVDEHGTFEIVNASYAGIYGFSQAEMQGQKFTMVVVESERKERAATYLERLHSNVESSAEAEVVGKDGQLFTVLSNSIPITGHDGRPRRAYFLVDISERKLIEQHLAHVAHHDALTGLPNRILFHDRLSQALLGSIRDRGGLAVLLVDLNRFKQVNDTFGHAAGDRLLQEVATRMHGMVRATDTVARLGGDEFAVLLPHASEHAAIFVATKILSALQAPVSLDDMPVEVGGSIGISLFPEHGEDPASLLSAADAAMYYAKSTGCGCAVNTVPANPH